MEFNKEQKLAIDTKDKNILLSAAAGSGKTKVLVEKIINMICDEEDSISIDNILVMTFTNNATNDMKNKIKKRLFEKIEEKEKNGEDISRLEYQMSIISGANIQTIDSFCKELIDNNFTRIENLDPKYRIADDKELELLRFDTLSEVLESKYNDKEYKEFFKAFYSRDGEMIKNMFNKGLFYFGAKAFPLFIIENLINSYDKNNIKENYLKYELLYLLLLKEYYELYEKKKQEKKILHIGDIQKYALSLLYIKDKDKYVYSDFCKDISDKYKCIFIDEYQDTSDVQEKIVDALSLGYTKKNVFMVGDVKQGIYRFRNADISIFNKKYDLYKNDNKDNVLIKLFNNYRSYKTVIDFVNELFSDVMTKEATKIDYSDDNQLAYSRDEEIIYEDENQKKIYENLDRSIDYYLVTGVGSKELKANAKYQELGKKNATLNDEAKLCVNIIKGLHDKNHIPYKDITILLRKEKDTFNKFMDVFQSVGIPASCSTKEGFYKSYEIQLLIDILSVIDNPYDDIKLVSVLTSCMLNVNNNELAFLKKEYFSYEDVNKSISYQMQDAINTYIDQYNDNKYDKKDIKDRYDIDIDILYEKLDKYNRLFMHFRDIERYKTISDLINIIVDETDLLYYINTMPLSSIRIENVKLLINKSKQYENTSYVGLNNFIRYLEKIKERDIDEGIAEVYSDNLDMVHITTIHKSKGLEYKVVIVPNLSSKYNDKSYIENDKRENLVCFNDEFGISINDIDYKNRIEKVTDKREIFDSIEKIESQSEEMRILYVALTRAKEKLILIDRSSTEKKIEDIKKACEKETLTKEDIIESNSYSKLMMFTISRLIKENIDWFNFIPVSVYSDRMFDVDKLISENLLKNNFSNKNNISEENQTIEKNKKMNDTYVKQYEFLTKLKPKISVSDIKSSHYEKIEDDNNFETYDVKDKYEVDTDIKGNDIGNIYHRFMEIYDFNSDVEKSLDKMIDEKLIDDSAKAIIKIDKIKKLLDSDIGKSLKKAHDDKLLYREQRFMKYFKKSEIEKYKNSGETIDSDKDVNIIVQGIFDAFYIEENNGKKTITLLDYKTDGLKNNNAKEEKLIENYKVQLDIYKKALEETVGLPVINKKIYSFALDKAIDV